jgi:hypothetical protein
MVKHRFTQSAGAVLGKALSPQTIRDSQFVEILSFSTEPQNQEMKIRNTFFKHKKSVACASKFHQGAVFQNLQVPVLPSARKNGIKKSQLGYSLKKVHRIYYHLCSNAH